MPAARPCVRSSNPIPPQPSVIVTQVDGSGTAEIEIVNGSSTRMELLAAAAWNVTPVNALREYSVFAATIPVLELFHSKNARSAPLRMFPGWSP